MNNMGEQIKALPRHRHRPLVRILVVTVAAALAYYALSYYRHDFFTYVVNDFIISDVFVIAFVIALVWGILVALSIRTMCQWHTHALWSQYRFAVECVVWGIVAAAAWLVFLLGLRIFIILNVMRLTE